MASCPPAWIDDPFTRFSRFLVESLMEEEPKHVEPLKHPISIALLFHLITLSAVAAACARYLVLDSVEIPTLSVMAGLLVGGAIVGLIVGVVVAIHRPNYRWMSPIIGILLGLSASPLLLIPIKNYWHITTISFLGCWILIVFSLLVARFRDGIIVSQRR